MVTPFCYPLQPTLKEFPEDEVGGGRKTREGQRDKALFSYIRQIYIQKYLVEFRPLGSFLISK